MIEISIHFELVKEGYTYFTSMSSLVKVKVKLSNHAILGMMLEKIQFIEALAFGGPNESKWLSLLQLFNVYIYIYYVYE